MNNHNRLITERIPKLIKEIALPASVGFFFHTMYNVVDTFYGGLISTEALAALTLSFPVFFIIIAIGSGISTGGTVLISNHIGAGRHDEKLVYSAQVISFGVLISFFLTVLGLATAPFLFKLLGASAQYLALSLAYINVIFYGTVFFLLNNVLNSALVAIGDTKTFRNYLIIGFFLNLILDPWFLLGGFGLPAMGLAGIALATVVIQVLGCFYMYYKVVKAGMFSRESWSLLKPRKKTFFEIAQQGFPASLNMMTVAIGIFVITYFISWFGQTAVAAYGIATRVEQIALLPSIGLNIAALTLIGQNNGAKQYQRIKIIIRKCLKYGLIIMTFGAIAVFFLPRQLMGIFTGDQAVILIGSQYLKIAAFILWAYVLIFINVSAMQGVKKPMFAVWIGLYRQIIAPIIVFLFLIKVMGWGLFGVWWGVFIITWSAALIALFYSKKVINRLDVV
ncbi:MAG TPA: MATE family efflux transporter [Patescibacteria group bacterium]